MGIGLGLSITKPSASQPAFVDPSSMASLRIWYKHNTGMTSVNDETTAAGNLDNGDQIKQWDDQSGQNNHATQLGATSDCPKYNNSGVTDGSLHFAGASKWMDLTSALDISANEDFTFLINAKFHDDSSRGLFGHDGSNFMTRENANQFRLLIQNSAQNNFIDEDAINSSATWSSANYYSIMVIRSGGASLSPVLKVYVDNRNNGDEYSNKQWGDTNGKNADGDINPGGDGQQFDVSNLGSKADDAGEMKGWMRHFSYYNEAVSDANRENLFTYLSNIS